MKSVLVPSVAKKAFDKIEKKLTGLGYELYCTEPMYAITNKDGTTTFKANYRVNSMKTVFGDICKIDENAPVLVIGLTAWADPTPNDPGQITYYLSVKASPIYNAWFDGSDDNLNTLVSNFIENEQIINWYDQGDYIYFEENKELDKLNGGLIEEVDLDEIDTQIKESVDISSLEDVEAKLDTIMDALGLTEDEDESEKTAEDSVEESPVVEEEIETEKEEPESEESSTPPELDNINFVD